MTLAIFDRFSLNLFEFDSLIRFSPYFPDSYGPHASASINVFKTILPSPYNSREHYLGPSPLHNGFGPYNTKLNYIDDIFAKGIRWEYGFKPPLVPSLEIDEFGNPKNC